MIPIAVGLAGLIAKVAAAAVIPRLIQAVTARVSPPASKDSVQQELVRTERGPISSGPGPAPGSPVPAPSTAPPRVISIVSPPPGAPDLNSPKVLQKMASLRGNSCLVRGPPARALAWGIKKQHFSACRHTRSYPISFADTTGLLRTWLGSGTGLGVQPQIVSTDPNAVYREETTLGEFKNAYESNYDVVMLFAHNYAASIGLKMADQNFRLEGANNWSRKATVVIVIGCSSAANFASTWTSPGPGKYTVGLNKKTVTGIMEAFIPRIVKNVEAAITNKTSIPDAVASAQRAMGTGYVGRFMGNNVSVFP